MGPNLGGVTTAEETMAHLCPGLKNGDPRGEPCHGDPGGTDFPGLSPPEPGAYGGGGDVPAHQPVPELQLKPKPGSSCLAWSKTRISSTCKTVSVPRLYGPSWQMQMKGTWHAVPQPPSKHLRQQLWTA